MILVFGGKDHAFDEHLARWVLERAGVQRDLDPGMYYAIGVMSHEEIVAGVLYHDYRKIGIGGIIELTFAATSPRWAHPRIVGALLHYPFVQLNCHNVLATVKKKNHRSRKLAAGLGFKECGTVHNWPYAEDTIIYELRREVASAKWLTRPVKLIRKAA